MKKLNSAINNYCQFEYAVNEYRDSLVDWLLEAENSWDSSQKLV